MWQVILRICGGLKPTIQTLFHLNVFILLIWGFFSALPFSTKISKPVVLHVKEDMQNYYYYCYCCSRNSYFSIHITNKQHLVAIHVLFSKLEEMERLIPAFRKIHFWQFETLLCHGVCVVRNCLNRLVCQSQIIVCGKEV